MVEYHQFVNYVYFFYIPGIYAEVYVVFAFPFIHLYVCLCVRHVRGIYDRVFDKVVLFSHEPLVRKHSYLDHRYLGVSAFIS